MLTAPLAPWKGAPLRVIFTAEKPQDGELALIAPDGSVAARSRERHGGPPYFWSAEVASPVAGMWHARLTRDRGQTACGTITRDIAVGDTTPPRPRASAGSVWPVRGEWNRATENLYSAWIEKLFDAPLDASPSWPALGAVLRDRSRNVLFNSSRCRRRRSVDADSTRLRRSCPISCARISPSRWDCRSAIRSARAAAAASRRSATRGSAIKAWARDRRSARRPASGDRPAATGRAGQAGRARGLFGRYLRVVSDAVHSGTMRTLANDDNTDFYTVPLKQESLRPGDGVRRSVRARHGAGAPRAADRRRGRRVPRG